MISLIRATFLASGILLAHMVAWAGGGQDGGKFDPGGMIIGHVTNEHGWHLWGHTSLPLPVIVYNSERGLSVFSSAHFHHGEQAHGGYLLKDGSIMATQAPDGTPAEQAPIDEELTKATIDLSITKNVVAIWVSVALMLLVFLSVAKAYTRRPGQAPKGLQSFIEPIIVFVRDEVAKPNIGPKYGKFLPFLLTVFFFILINNLMGLVPWAPGGANVTGSLSVTLTLAAFTFILTLINGNRHYWGHIIAMPGVPKPVLLILTPVEILGVFLRPAILMIRLFANITAGHIIVLSFFSLIFIFGGIKEGSEALGFIVSPFTLVFTIFMTMLELLVAFIQAFVFTFLSAMYLGAAIEEPHHH
jgi:F-type H+-transporting ATPase subunit a